MSRSQVGIQEAAKAREHGKRRREPEATIIMLLPDGEEGLFGEMRDGEEARDRDVGECYQEALKRLELAWIA